MSKKTNILFTKQLTDKQRFSNTLNIEDYNFITIDELPFEYPSSPASHLLFTSKNAVDAVLKQHKINKTQSIYAVGEATKNRLLSYDKFTNIKTPENQSDAETLIELFKEDKANDFTYFCGKKRLPKLEDYFNENNIKYRIVEVYDTRLSPPSFLEVNKYEWLCFCSPSAVKSFQKKYEILPFQKTICIGKTTANALDNTNNVVEIAPNASIESMINYIEKQYKK